MKKINKDSLKDIPSDMTLSEAVRKVGVDEEGNFYLKKDSEVKRSKKVDVPTEQWQKDVEKKMKELHWMVSNLYGEEGPRFKPLSLASLEERIEALEKGEK